MQKHSNSPCYRSLGKRKSPSYPLGVLVFILAWTIAFGANPLTGSTAVPLSDATEAGLGCLLDFRAPDGTQVDLDVNAIQPVLEMIRQAPEMGHYLPRDRQKARGSFIAFTVQRPLDELIRYAYNSRIPEGAINPSSIHYSKWTEVSGSETLPDVWRMLDDLPQPAVIRGAAREIIAPDLHTGAYYEYELQRALVLLNHEGSRVVISLSNQIGHSEVGRKGLIVGSDQDWNYLYTPDEGLNKSGLGWVKSRIYQFFSICVYIEAQDRPGVVKMGVFQWLGAGWAGFNMVGSHHIRNGLERYASQFKAMLESEKMPSAAVLEHLWAALWQTGEELLREKAHDVTRHIQTKAYQTGDLRERQGVSDFDAQSYVHEMSKDQLITLLMREYIKLNLGKETPLHAAFWLAIKSNGAPETPL